MPSSLGPRGEETVFRATGLSPVYMVQIVAFAFGLAGLGLAWHLWQAPRHPLADDSAHGVTSALLTLLAVASPTAAWAYARRLAAEVRLTAERGLRVRDAVLFGGRWRSLALSDVSVAKVLGGDAAGEASVSPARLRVLVAGGRDFIVPLGRGRRQADRLLALLREGT